MNEKTFGITERIQVDASFSKSFDYVLRGFTARVLGEAVCVALEDALEPLLECLLPNFGFFQR